MNHSKVLKIYFCVSGIIGIAVVIDLTIKTITAYSQTIRQFSTITFGFLVGAVFLCTLYLYCAFRMYRSLTALSIITSTLFLIPSRYYYPIEPIHQNVRPALLWISLITTFLLAWLISIDIKPGSFQKISHQIIKYRKQFTLIALLWLTLISIVIIGRIGLTFDNTMWYQAGVPILTWQFYLALLIAILVLLLRVRSRSPNHKFIFDIAILLIIWLSAAIIWNTVELKPNYFFTVTGREKTYHPYSDARRYSFNALSILEGQGSSPTEDKPIYYFFLAAIQSFTGFDYLQTVAVQSSILALGPALLFLLGRLLHSSEAGVLVAGMAIASGANAILLGQDINLSHTKLLMAENPSAVLLILSSLMLIIWFIGSHKRWSIIFIAGCVVGFAALIRLNNYLMIFTAIGLSALVYFSRGLAKSWLKHVLIFILGVSAIIGPWNLMTYHVIGIPYSVRKFSDTLRARNILLINTPEDVGPSNEVSRPTPKTKESAKDDQEDQSSLIRAGSIIINRFFHNEVMSILILPTTFEFVGLDHFVNHPAWSPKSDWQGELRFGEILLIVINIILLTLGIAAAYRHLGWAGLTPLAIHMSYHLTNGLARKSGGRYLIPVDWVIYLYYGIAIMTLIHIILKYFYGIQIGVKDSNQYSRLLKSTNLQPVLSLAAALLVLAGFSLPASRTLIKSDDRFYNAEELTALVGTDPAFKILFPSSADINHFLNQDYHFAVSGTIVYPQKSNHVENNPHGEQNFEIDYPSFNFSFLSPQPSMVLFPIESRHDFDAIPEGEKAIVIGCWIPKNTRVTYAIALIHLQKNKSPTVFIQPENFVPPCNYSPK